MEILKQFLSFFKWGFYLGLAYILSGFLTVCIPYAAGVVAIALITDFALKLIKPKEAWQKDKGFLNFIKEEAFKLKRN